ncbi:MAG: ArsR/SmtB family transcription factor [Candidatus Latescibacterota bacterium]
MTDPLKVYKALADETRLRLVRLLVRGALNVNEIIGILGMGQSRISRHLKILSEAELVTKRREGTWIYYEGNGQASEPIVVEALEMCERHERAMPNYTEDLQGLENVVEGRRQQMRNFFDNIKDPDQLQQALDGNYYRKIAIEQVPEGAGTVLDMGTGAGLLLPGLLRRAQRVIAVDSSTTMLDMARKALGKETMRCDFRLGDLGHLPVADGEVDLVMACMVLHHLSRPAEAIREAYRALAPNGRLVVVDLYRHEDETLREQLADLWLGFLPSEVESWLREHRFTTESAEVVGADNSLQLIAFQAIKKDD